MYIKNDTIGVIFRVLFLIVCGAGLVMKLFASGFSLSVILGDFALLANALALVYFAYLIIARPSYERGFLRGAVTIYMVRDVPGILLLELWDGKRTARGHVPGRVSALFHRTADGVY